MKLDDYIRWVQGVLTQYEGLLLQLIIGDKGSYLYAAFGAHKAHEDDARRAAMAALDLRAPPANLHFVQPVQIGISQGTVRAGTYGGTTRRTYGVLSDEVNLAARLQSLTRELEATLVIEPVTRDALGGHGGDFEERDEVPIRGRSQAMRVYSLPLVKI